MANPMPIRILHAMLRVSDLDASVNFYCDILGMKELRREIYETGAFSLSFIGYGDEAENTVLELTYNHDQPEYAHGDRFGHIAFEVDDIDATFQRLEDQGVRTLRQPGPMLDADQNGKRDVIAFVEDPDGYRIELIAKT
jgi:lactoylglutathione lyase